MTAVDIAVVNASLHNMRPVLLELKHEQKLTSYTHYTKYDALTAGAMLL